jgi:RimJ/RimL family protein N-acetyltransferase
MSQEREQPLINILGEKVALGPLQRELLPLYTRWINDFEIVTTLGQVSVPITLDKEEKWYESIHNEDINFTIYLRDSWQPIGTTGLKKIDYRNQRCEFGILIGEKDCWNKGYGSESAYLLLDYGFNMLGLHSINLTVYSSNLKAIRAYEKAGYKVAGRLREVIRFGQEFQDLIYMDCLATEFGKPR